MTYPDRRVQQCLNERFVPLQIELPKGGKEVDHYQPIWTPTFLFLQADGTEADREMGYLPPADFLARLALGRAKIHLQKEAYAEAAAVLREPCASFSENVFTPEIHYWLGVSRYKSEGKPDGLLEEWNALLDRWPESRWARSASFIRQG